MNWFYRRHILRIVSMLSILLLAGSVGAIPVEEWHKTFGGINDDLAAYSAQQTSDGGYIIAGTNGTEASSMTPWLIKTDANGNQQWSNTFGIQGEAKFVQQTSDGGYIIAGTILIYSDTGWQPHVFLIKTDADGRQQWSKTFRTGGSGSDYADSALQTTDGGYIIAGRTTSDQPYFSAFLIKTDANGNQQWGNRYTINSMSYYPGYFVQQTFDGGYIIGAAFTLIKTDANGKQQWYNGYGGIAYSALQTSDGGYIVAGGIGNPGDAWLSKVNSTGNIQWQKTFGGANFDVARSIQQTLDGGYIIAGITNSYGSGKSDAWLIKTDANGNQQWSTTFGGASDDEAYSVKQPSDGGFILAGRTSSYGAGGYDAWLIKVSSESGTLTPTPTTTPAPTPTSTTSTPTTPTPTTPTSTTSTSIKRAQLQVTYDTSLANNERITIRVVLKNIGNATASNINLTIDHTPELEPIVLSGSQKIGETITWKGELKPNEEHISEYSIKGIRGKYLEIPLKVTYFKISPEEKARVLGVSSAPLTPDEQEIIILIIRAILKNPGFEAIIAIMLLVFVTVILKNRKGG